MPRDADKKETGLIEKQSEYMMIESDFKKCLPALIGVVLTMTLIPFGLQNRIGTVLIFLSCYLLWMVLTKKPGYSLIIMATTLTLVSIESDFFDNSIFGNRLTHIYRYIMGSTIAIAAYKFFIEKKRYNSSLIYMWIIYFTICMFYAAFANDSLSQNIIGATLSIYLFFFVCYTDEFSSTNLSRIINTMALITIAYAILQHIFDICPYNWLYERVNDPLWADNLRARGILGNSLILTGSLLFFQASQYIQFFRTRKISIVLLILNMIAVLFTGSRTAIIVSLFMFGYYFMTAKLYKSAKAIIIVSITILSFTLFTINYLGDFLDLVATRFIEGEANHRLAAFGSVANLVSDNIFGVGSANVLTEIRRYATTNLLRDFTLDNFFLKEIAAFGIFSILVFAFYFLFVYEAYKLRNANNWIWKSICLLFIIWSLIGFSFDASYYRPTVMTYYGLAAYLLAATANGQSQKNDRQNHKQEV